MRFIDRTNPKAGYAEYTIDVTNSSEVNARAMAESKKANAKALGIRSVRLHCNGETIEVWP